MADVSPVSLETLAPWGSDLLDPQRIMTAAELLRDSTHAKGYELVEGRLIRLSPTGGIHGLLSGRIARVIGNYVDAHHLGAVLGAETGFIIARNPDSVLAPDVAFVVASRQVNIEGYLPFAPDLAVEVASPDQYKPEMATKAQKWLAAGTQLVWIVWFKTQQVDVWQPNQPMLTLHASDMLDGYTVLPGFTLLVSKVFD